MFDKFLSKFINDSWKPDQLTIDAMRAAFEAGQASPNVITAYQLQARIGKFIADHDAETRTVLKRLEEKQEPQVVRYYRNGRDSQIQKFTDAFGIVMDFIANMETERQVREPKA